MNVDTELLLDYITYLELKYMGKLVNGRLPFFDDEMTEPEYIGGENSENRNIYNRGR